MEGAECAHKGPFLKIIYVRSVANSKLYKIIHAPYAQVIRLKWVTLVKNALMDKLLRIINALQPVVQIVDQVSLMDSVDDVHKDK